jgi:phosphomannomutase
MAFSHRFDPTTLREYDIRGTVGGTLSEADAFAIGRCFGSIVVRKGGVTVAVGYDGRLSSPQLEQALVKGLSASGIEAVRIGRGPTPMLYYASTTLKTDGAVMVTGSLNPPDYNGFKMVLGGKPFFGEQIRALGDQAMAGDVVEETVAPERNIDVAGDYVARLLTDWDGGDRLLKVVWDNGNGAAGEVLQRLVAGLPGEHTVLNGEIDGRFPAHHPDPTVPANLQQLIAEVAAQGADIGIALDGDADRVVIADEQGHLVDGDQLLAAIAESWSVDGRLAKPGVVATVMSNLGLERHLQSLNLDLVRTPVGDRYVLEYMREHGYNVGGEPSGHIILSDYTTTGDGFVAALQVLAVVKKQNKPVSQVCHRFAALPQVLKNVRYRSGKPLENSKVRSAIEDAEQRLNGHGRLVVRPSGTEPVIRVMGEGDDKALVEEVVDGIVDALTDIAA